MQARVRRLVTIMQIDVLPAEDLYKRNLDLIATSGALEWLENAGIPTDPRPRKKLMTSAQCDEDIEIYITTMNVIREDLTKNYRWQFYNEHEVGISAYIEGYTPALRTLDLLFLKNREFISKGGLKMPKEWNVQNEERGGSVTRSSLARQALVGYLKWLNEINVTVRRRAVLFEFDDIAGPDSDAVEQTNRTLSPGIERTLMKIFDLRGLRYRALEMDAERQVGSTLAGVFDIPLCTRIRNKPLCYPTVLGCFGSYARPSLVCQLYDTHRDRLALCRPILLVGEAMRTISYDHARFDDNNKDILAVAARLACAVQPTLQLFMIHLTMKYRHSDGTWDPQWDPFTGAKIPEHMVVFGIGYNQEGILIYAFFPRYILNKQTRTLEWGFGCREMTTSHRFSFDRHSIAGAGRVELCRSILTIMDWARNSAQKLSSDKFHLELLINYITVVVYHIPIMFIPVDRGNLYSNHSLNSFVDV
ncbi:hypothetical protein A0H81_12883 [Grifola frondosa]|uniref:Uncharacterized protein n=1 Tax=Grifola frondosa TaxID=5627 RepID=A0A1C7LQZ2_GRIFR|nr:hypothetical protein A0H81_12883 [Grifola frondosa]